MKCERAGHPANQFTGTEISYDLAGDMTADTVYSYTYDAENRIITASGMTNGPYCYTYNANGMRVMKAHASGGSCTGTVTVDMMYWRDFAGNTIAETDGTGSATNANYNEYVFFAGRRIAQSNPSSGNVYYYFVDHLGSTRVVTTATGTACYEVDFLPYGTENTPSGFSNTCSTRYRFTGYERDQETAAGTSAGNDYAYARYYNSRLGRFMSGDPLDGDISDPQTLNKYAYVRNNPINEIDPTGLSGYCFPWGCSDPTPIPPPPPNPVNSGDDGGVVIVDFCESIDGICAGGPPYGPAPPVPASKVTKPTPQAPLFDTKAYQQCVSSFQGSAAGKVVKFGSLVSFMDDAWGTAKLWGEAITVKFSLLQAFEMGAKSAGGGSTPLTLVKPAVGTAATAGMAVATVADVLARETCAAGASTPELNNAAVAGIP